MVKFVVKIVLICLVCLTILISSLSAYKPKDLYRDQVAVLMYHHIHDKDLSSGTITTTLFRDQLAYLKSKGYQFITLQEFKRFMQGAPVPDNAVLVTFDDGYESFYLNAFPILQQLHIGAVNFVITKDLENPQDSNIPSLSREEIRSMTQSSALIDVQCHTNALHGTSDNGKALLTGKLMDQETEESEATYEQRIIQDTKACISSLNGLYPQPIDSLAYPYGIFNESAAELIHKAGINYAFTVLPKMTTREMDPLKIPRLNAGSPYVTPESLHNMIMRRVTIVKHPYDNVVLRDTVEQIGGDITVDKAGNTVIHYNGDQWLVKPNSRDVMHHNVPLTTDKPIQVVGNKTYISLNDLQKILNLTIFFNPATQTFTTTLPANSDSDMETNMPIP
jgi:peptidoglycan/xylan/chitin deacetylase (PgdA/CDA1 family)